MRWTLVWLCVVTYVSCAVQVLTEENFDEKTKEGIWLVKFYAPWCGHCKSLAPLYETLSNDLESLVGANIAKVDCTSNKNVCKRFEVQGYPTLKALSNGQYYNYQGRRTIDDMLAFITGGYDGTASQPILSYEQKTKLSQKEEEMKKDSKVITLTQQNFQQLVLDDDTSGWFLKFYAPWCGHCKRLAPTWHKLSNSLENTNTKVGMIDCTKYRRLCTRFDITGYPSLYYVRDKEYYLYNQARTIPTFINWDNGEYKQQTSLGSVPAEALGSTMVDGALEWANEHAIFAAIVGVGLLALCVGLLVALLDYCMGDEEDEIQTPKKKKKNQ